MNNLELFLYPAESHANSLYTKRQMNQMSQMYPEFSELESCDESDSAFCCCDTKKLLKKFAKKYLQVDRNTI